jgi:hypothetical protein
MLQPTGRTANRPTCGQRSFVSPDTGYLGAGKRWNFSLVNSETPRLSRQPGNATVAGVGPFYVSYGCPSSTGFYSTLHRWTVTHCLSSATIGPRHCSGTSSHLRTRAPRWLVLQSPLSRLIGIIESQDCFERALDSWHLPDEWPLYARLSRSHLALPCSSRLSLLRGPWLHRTRD